MSTPLVPSDLLRFILVGDPQIAPGGAAVFYRRSWFDPDADEIRGAIDRVDASGAVRAFTAGTNDRMPRVAPDGSALAFVAERDGKAQVFVLPLDGGAARAVGEPRAKIMALAWSPDAKRLAIVAPAERETALAGIYVDEKSGARHIRRLPFKSDADGLLDGLRAHLFVADLADGTCVQVTRGDFDVATPCWSPDGAQLAFAARDPEVSESATSLCDIWVVSARGGAPRRVTGGDGPMGLPAFSCDGKRIAFLGHRHGDDGGGRFDLELLVVDAGGGEPRSLSATLGRTAGDAVGGDLRSGGTSAPVWSAGDREIFVQVCDEGATSVRAFATDGGGVRVVAGGERQIYGFSALPDGAVAIAFSDPVTPGEIALIPAGGAERVLTRVNPWLADRDVAAPRRYRPRADDGTELDAWLLEPKHTRGRVPLVLEVHGGPHAAYGWTFFLEFQVLAAAGIAVAYGNPRGSQSYGHAYANAAVGDWGGLDAADCLRILDGALELGEFDETRLGVAGGSYGGFMTTWLAGHSDRFKAAVSMRAVNDHLSEIGASDVGWFLERELEAPWSADAGKKLFDMSPIRGAGSIACPFLVEHSERDYRCPIDQGEQLFTLLRRLGKTDTEFVRFTDKGHEMSRAGKPRSRILRLRAIAHWFVRHLKPAGSAPGTAEAGSLFAPLPGEEDAA